MKTMSRSFLLLALGASATFAIGCGSKSSGGSDGGGGAGLQCPDPPEETGENTISDFEDGRAAILQFGNRNGGWYPYNSKNDAEFIPDEACMETPMVNRCATEAPAATTIPDTRCGSTYAFRFVGMGCKGYAGVGTDLAAALIPDGGVDPTVAICADGGTPGVAHKTPYPLTSYKAISFWGRSGEMSLPKVQSIEFKLPMLVDTKVEDGGDCDKAVNKCSASYEKVLAFKQIWQKYTVNLDPTDKVNGISQPSWGKAFTWDPTNVTSIQFQAQGNVTYDIWIDDIQLIPR